MKPAQHYWRPLRRALAPAVSRRDSSAIVCAEASAKVHALATADPISLWAAQSLDFHPDPRQAEILDSPAHRLILLCTRQFGKSTLSAVKALHFALHHPDSLTVVAAPSLRRSAEWIRLVRRFLHLLHLKPRTDRIHPHSLLLPNGARLVALPGVVDNNRGYPAHLLVFEEAAVIPSEMFEVLTGSLAATNGALWLISSAGPDHGFFYDQWRHREASWTRFKITATECPRISPEFLQQERLLIGEPAFRREFLCEFLPQGDQVISRELLEAALSDTVRPWNGGKPLWPQ